MKPLLSALICSSLLASVPTALAQTPAAETTTASLPQVEAEVRKVDISAGKITLKHGDIPNLDMPPMTMVFQVKDKSQLTDLKPGDKIRIRADKLNGAYTAVDIQR